MWFEIFKFEIQYRAKRADTYIYFAILFLSSLVAVDFIFQGNLGTVKYNAPYIIAYTMAVASAIFLMIASMIMGVAALRDFDHNMESLMFVNPVKKWAYLLGRFLGSFIVLIFIFSSLILGLILGNFMPWREADDLLSFDVWHYLQPFLFFVLPNLFFAGAIFFVGGALSRKLIVVYTQGILLLVVYLISGSMIRGAEDPFIAALFDPLSLNAISTVIDHWTPAERNSMMLPIESMLLYNRFIWIGVGIVALAVGYIGFSFNVVRSRIFKKQRESHGEEKKSAQVSIILPSVTLPEGMGADFKRFKYHSLFYFKSILKEIPFWAIMISGVAIILLNGISLDTKFGVDSYPASYLIVEELQEMSIAFFLLILIFYSGELVWKERNVKIDQIYDALPVTDFLNLMAKFLGLLLTYVVLMLAMILAGVIIQTLSGYYQYNFEVYIYGFFMEILPFLVMYTFLSFFFQVMVNHKFIGQLLTLVSFILILASELFELEHGLVRFGGSTSVIYSDMNGYGHLLEADVWIKIYWIAVCLLIFLVAVLFSVRGTETRMKKRWKLGKHRLTKPVLKLGAFAVLVFTISGSYVFYNTNILNTYASSGRQVHMRVNYEKTLKRYEYLPQPKIVDVNLTLDLYPYERDYVVEGYYMLHNKHNEVIREIHIQGVPNSQIRLEQVKFEGGATFNNEYEEYGYHIYQLNHPLKPDDSIKMEFKQSFTTHGFVDGESNTDVIYNGSFLKNDHFPTLGYNKKFELQDTDNREDYGLAPRINMAKRDDPHLTGEKN